MTSGAVRKRKAKKEKKSHKKKKDKKKSKKKSKSSPSPAVEGKRESTERSGEDVNLSEEMYPLGHYINDKSEMINQMFSIIKGEKLRAMLPPSLKKCSNEDLRTLCLDELLGMSKKRILGVLEGRDVETSSESDDGKTGHAHNSGERSSRKISLSPWSSTSPTFEPRFHDNQQREEMQKEKMGDDKNGTDLDTLEIGITQKEMGELFDYMPSSKRNEKSGKRRYHSPARESETSTCPSKKSKSKTASRKKTKDSEKQIKHKKKSSETITSSEEKRSLQTSLEVKTSSQATNSSQEKESEENDDTSTSKSEESKGKNLLEILELEMRARAIRALLKQQLSSEEETVEPSTLAEGEEELMVPSEMPQLIKSQIKGSQDSKTYSPDNPDGKGLGQDKESPKSKLKGRGREMEKGNVTQSSNIIEQSNVSSDLTERSIKSGSSFPRKPNHSGNKKNYETDKHGDRGGTCEDSSQGSFCSAVKIEVIHFTEKDEGSSEWVSTGRKIVSGKASSSKSSILHDQCLEDGELSDEADIFQVESSQNDANFAENSNDALLEGDEDKRVHKDLTEQDLGAEISSRDAQRQQNCPADITDNVTTKDTKLECEFEKKLPRLPNYSRATGDDVKELEKKATFEAEIPSKKGDSTEFSWASRWLQSKGVQKVVSTSKMCAKIRKRMQCAQRVKQITASASETEESPKSPIVIIEGSVKEYKMLDKPSSKDEGQQDSTEHVMKSPKPDDN